MPSAIGGESAGTPQAPANPPAFPAVHDMPAARSVPLMTEEEQKAAEADLIAARDRQNPKKKAAPAQGNQQAASRQSRPAKKPAPESEQPPSSPSAQ